MRGAMNAMWYGKLRTRDLWDRVLSWEFLQGYETNAVIFRLLLYQYEPPIYKIIGTIVSLCSKISHGGNLTKIFKQCVFECYETVKFYTWLFVMILSLGVMDNISGILNFSKKPTVSFN